MAGAYLASHQRALTDRLVNLTGQLVALLRGHLLGIIPAVLIEASSRPAALPTAFATAALLEVVEHLRAVPCTILLVEAADLERTCHGGELVGLVVVHQLDVNHEVTGGVSQLMVLVIHPAPRGQVPIELVIALVQHQEAQLGVVELVDKGTAIDLVSPIGIGGRAQPNIVLDTAVADHQDARKGDVFGVGHDVDHGLL